MCDFIKDRISVIVPIYNVEKYLGCCIESIINQTYQNIEIILVDDGSYDNSSQICEEYAAKDERIKVIHMSNSGVSAARNKGLDCATGNYISFVDSDDFIEETMLEEMFLLINNNNCDLVMCNFKRHYGNTNGDERNDILLVKDEILSQKELYDKLYIKKGLSNWSYVVLWNKLYKKEIFDNIRFPIGKIHEDEYMIHHIFEKVNRAIVTKKVYYNYRCTPYSITNKNYNVQRLDFMDALLDRAIFFNEKKWYELEYNTTYIYFIKIMDKLPIFFEGNKKEMQRIFTIRRKLFKNIFLFLHNPYFTFKKKILILCLCINFNLYKKVVKQK